MAPRAFALFDTPLGPCAVAWNERAIVGVQLPESEPAATRRRMQTRFPDAVERTPPEPIQRSIDAMVALLRGEPRDLRDLPLELDGLPEFQRRVYEIARTIPPGSTLSYGELARRMGVPGAARAVGQALGKNPFPIVVPCHRVLAAGGKMGGFSAAGGVSTKARMLRIEKALLDG